MQVRDKHLAMGWTNRMHFQTRPVVLNISMLYLSKASFLYALTPIFLVPQPIANFTHDHHQYMYPHVLGTIFILYT